MFYLRTARLRATPAYTLSAFDELPDAERAGLGSLLRDPSFYGVLTPKDPLLPRKSVSQAAALLFMTLREPKSVPSLLDSIFGENLAPLEALLADGILEAEDGSQWLSGHRALARLRKTVLDERPLHRLQRLSRDAIAHAASLTGLDAAELAGRVYVFGRLPCTPRIRSRFATAAGVFAFLTHDRATRDLLESAWTPIDGDRDASWLAFRSSRSGARPGFKLYVSARPAAMPSVFAMTLRAMKATECAHFKIGSGPLGVCRPDKTVAYFTTQDALLDCARRIELDLREAEVPDREAHGVPFTAPIDAAGFLSWGMDPPELGLLEASLEHQSFRQWVTSRVAVASITARHSAAVDVEDFVLGRLALDGIDPLTFVPSTSMWRGHAARPEDVA